MLIGQRRAWLSEKWRVKHILIWMVVRIFCSGYMKNFYKKNYFLLHLFCHDQLKNVVYRGVCRENSLTNVRNFSEITRHHSNEQKTRWNSWYFWNLNFCSFWVAFVMKIGWSYLKCRYTKYTTYTKSLIPINKSVWRKLFSMTETSSQSSKLE